MNLFRLQCVCTACEEVHRVPDDDVIVEEPTAETSAADCPSERAATLTDCRDDSAGIAASSVTSQQDNT